MSLCRMQIEKPEWAKIKKRKSHKWLKKQMNRYIRRSKLEDFTGKVGRKPTNGWEY